MIRLHEFAGCKVPDSLELFRLTDAFSEPSCHVYMEAQIFLPDSKRFVLHRSAHPHGSDPADPRHAYFLCDLENNGELTELASEPGVCAPAFAPDGSFFYYFLRDLHGNGGSITLMRCRPDGSDRTMLARVDGSTSIAQPAFHMYPLSTISSDGGRIAACGPLRRKDPAREIEHGLWVFDTKNGSVSMPVRGPDFCNLHPQYTRNPAAPHDIMIQHNHGSRSSPSEVEGTRNVSTCAALDTESGCRIRAVSASQNPRDNNTGYGIDIHLIRDDATGMRSFPWGRDGVEACQGHQCWRGESEYAIASTLLFLTPSTANQELIEAKPFEGFHHDGKCHPGASRNVLTQRIVPPHFLHFATDRAGRKIVSDYEAENGEWHLYAGTLGDAGKVPADWKFMLNLGSREKSPFHPHPFLSPDGKWAFFNSSASGRLHAYALRRGES